MRILMGYNEMYYGKNRYLCSVLEEMRAQIEIFKEVVPKSSYCTLLSLVEEVQTMGNRMEASLQDFKDLDKLNSDIKTGKNEYKKILKDKEELENDITILKSIKEEQQKMLKTTNNRPELTTTLKTNYPNK